MGAISNFVKSRVLAEGTAVDDLLHPDRILIGGDSSEEGQKAIRWLRCYPIGFLLIKY
jgi:UDP-glucose 6-dehydrogenase